VTRLLVYATAMLLAFPQRGDPQQPPVFRSGVGLVTLDVRVLDSDGRPVTGLTSEDFVVELAGKKQPVRVVEYLAFPGADVVPELTDAPVATAPGRPVKQDQPPGRAVLLAVDDLSFGPQQSQAFVAAARRIIGGLGGNDSVGLALTGGRGLTVSMSRDKRNALLALRTITGKRVDPTQEGASQRVGPTGGTEVVLSSAEALAIEGGSTAVLSEVTQRLCGRSVPSPGGVSTTCKLIVNAEATQQAAALERASTMQFEGLREMVDALRNEPAPRILVLLSGGMDTDSGHAGRLDGLRASVLAASVQVYVLEPGLSSGGETNDRTAARSRVRRDNDEFSRRGLEYVAGVLDGEVSRVIGGVDHQIDRVIVGWSGSYRVAVEQPATITRAGPVPVGITVRRPGLTVKTPKFVMVGNARGTNAAAAADTTPRSPEANLARLVDEGGLATGVPIAMGVASKRDDAGHDVQVLTVEVPAAVRGPLSGLFAATDDSNRVIARGTLTLLQLAPGDDHRVSAVVPIPPGPYRIRVAVADASGEAGSAEQSGTARLSRLRSSTVSDLLVSWVGDDGKARFVAMETVPAGARMLQAALEFYATGEPAGTKVMIALLRDGVSTPFAEVQPSTIKTAFGWRLGVSVPLAALEAGVYTVRATIAEGSDPPLVLTRNVRKTGPQPPK
jgi:VWFA-related protein